MKNPLALMLAAALALYLVDCGGGGGAGDNNTTPSGGEDSTPENEAFHLGDTVTTDDIELTLTGFEYGEWLSCSLAIDDVQNDNFLLPPADGRDLTYTLKQEATEGHILITFSFEVKSFSKTTLDISDIFERFDVDYNDGYLFENSGLFVDLANKWRPVNGLLDAEIEPLDSTVYEFRGYLEVPEEVVSNTDSSLNLNVYLDGHVHGRTIPDFIFNIR